jgi:hypothetical protein
LVLEAELVAAKKKTRLLPLIELGSREWWRFVVDGLKVRAASRFFGAEEGAVRVSALDEERASNPRISTTAAVVTGITLVCSERVLTNIDVGRGPPVLSWEGDIALSVVVVDGDKGESIDSSTGTMLWLVINDVDSGVRAVGIVVGVNLDAGKPGNTDGEE